MICQTSLRGRIHDVMRKEKANIESIEMPHERMSHYHASRLPERELASRLTNFPCPVTALKTLCSLNSKPSLHLTILEGSKTALSSATFIGVYGEQAMAQPIQSSKGQCLHKGVACLPSPRSQSFHQPQLPYPPAVPLPLRPLLRYQLLAYPLDQHSNTMPAVRRSKWLQFQGRRECRSPGP